MAGFLHKGLLVLGVFIMIIGWVIFFQSQTTYVNAGENPQCVAQGIAPYQCQAEGIPPYVYAPVVSYPYETWGGLTIALGFIVIGIAIRLNGNEDND